MDYKLLLLILIQVCYIAGDNLELFVRDFLLEQKCPTKVVIFSEWRKARKVEFLKLLYSINVYTYYASLDPKKLKKEAPEEHILFVTDLSKDNLVKILLQANNLNLFKHPYRWLILNSNFDDKDPTLNFEITTDSQVFFGRTNTSNSYDVFLGYKVPVSGSFLIETVGKWIENKGFLYFENITKIMRKRSNLQKLNFNIGYVFSNKDSDNHIWDYKNYHIDAFPKIFYIVSYFLANMLNVTSSFIRYDSWGYKNKTMAHYPGMIGGLETGEIEIGGPLFLTTDRVPLLDYVGITSPGSVEFIFRSPPLSYVSNVLTLPFEKIVWITCFMLTVISTLILHVIFNWESKNLETAGGICQQGSEIEPLSLAGRITYFITFLVFMFLYTAYSANIVALLQTTSDEIDTLQDLLHSRIKLGAEDQKYSRHYFTTETEPMRKQIYEQKILSRDQSNNNFMNVEEGVEKVRNSFFAFHVELGPAYKVIRDTFFEHEKCDLKQISYLRLSSPWCVLRKNSSFKEIVKIGFKRIYENGVGSREVNRYVPKKPTCSGKINVFVSVGLIDCYYAFLIFGIGIGLTLFFLIVELFIKYFKKINTVL